MSKIIVKSNIAGIEGLCMIEPKVFDDNRGSFTEAYNESEFFEYGLSAHFVQDNEVHSKKGVLRGMHVNVNHPQAKLIRVLRGTIFDVVVDLRRTSVTYGKWFGVELSADNKKQLYIPEGFGHGYLTLSDADVLFKVTTHYIPGDEIGFAWNSTQNYFKWPVMDDEYIMSLADKSNPQLATLEFRGI